jgi:D-lactate dehydrogenase
MRVAVFGTKPYDRSYLQDANEGHGHELVFFEPRLTSETAPLGHGFPAICAFVNDDLREDVLTQLAAHGTRYVALRSAGFNNVDLRAAGRLDVRVARVPAYSPFAVAEHALGLIMTLNRRTHRAYNRVREGNFSLVGMIGFDVRGRTVGVIGTGSIGSVFCRIMRGLGCTVLAFDPAPSAECEALGVRYVELDELYRESDIVVLHCPLTPSTYHIIDADALEQMKTGVMLINTSRGALIDTRAVIDALKTEKIGYLGLDVYEEEADLFFEDLSEKVITDDVFARLLTFPNVLITGHQGFLTEDALREIARTTIQNLSAFEHGAGELHELTLRGA